MNERIREFLIAENKSSAQMAEEIGVQPSGISHILSGRNNPSLDFILKMLEKYHFLSTDWLLFGKGAMYKDSKMQTLFDENSGEQREIDSTDHRDENHKPYMDPKDVQSSDLQNNLTVSSKNRTSAVTKIVWFYDNNSFEEYFPSN